MRHPANAHWVVADYGLMLEQRGDQRHQRQSQQHDGSDQHQLVTLTFEKCGFVGNRQPVNDIAEEAVQKHFDGGYRAHQHRHDKNPRPGTARIVAAKVDQSGRWPRRHLGREWR
jgi:hypothetical protein